MKTPKDILLIIEQGISKGMHISEMKKERLIESLTKNVLMKQWTCWDRTLVQLLQMKDNEVRALQDVHLFELKWHVLAVMVICEAHLNPAF